MPFTKGNKLWELSSGKTRFKKGKPPWNKGRKETRKEVLQRQSKSHIGKKQSVELVEKRGNFLVGEKAKHWKGENIGYKHLHLWIAKNKGKAKDHKCKCGKIAKEWSNKDHKYRRRVEDYEAMCKKCHYWYDRQVLGVKFGRKKKQ